MSSCRWDSTCRDCPFLPHCSGLTRVPSSWSGAWRPASRQRWRPPASRRSPIGSRGHREAPPRPRRTSCSWTNGLPCRQSSRRPIALFLTVLLTLVGLAAGPGLRECYDDSARPCRGSAAGDGCASRTRRLAVAHRAATDDRSGGALRTRGPVRSAAGGLAGCRIGPDGPSHPDSRTRRRRFRARRARPPGVDRGDVRPLRALRPCARPAGGSPRCRDRAQGRRFHRQPRADAGAERVGRRAGGGDGGAARGDGTVRACPDEHEGAAPGVGCRRRLGERARPRDERHHPGGGNGAAA